MKKRIPVRRLRITGHEVRETNGILEKLASQFPKDAKEYKALELAAKALLFAYHSESAAAFRSYLQHCGSELTDEQKKQLRSIGIEP